MDKLKMHSPELADRNIAAIAGLFPNVVTETLDDEGKAMQGIDFDLLRQELSDHVVEGPQERYHLDWPGKRKALCAANAPISMTLRPIREESVNFDNTQNLFIEGDNLDALKLLQESYLGKIKLIYIDPPYNTGNDFVYNDNFAESIDDYLTRSGQRDDEGARLVANTESNGRFHSDWLSMMYPRLKLARNLLTEDGLLIVSVDDHEVHNLRTLAGEVFGNQNFVGLITRATGTPTGGGFDGLTNMVDYLLIFRRSDLAVVGGLQFSESDAAIYNEQDDRGYYLTRSLRRTGGEDRREDRPSMYYGIEAPDGRMIYPSGPGGYESRWICGRDRYEQLVNEGLIEWKQIERNEGAKWHPYQKFYLEGREKRPSNLWLDLDGNKKATRELRELFESKKVFDSPKPTALVQRIVQIGTDKDSIVLDFFAGSATTAAAVLQANSSDGGTRRFILVQLPEEVPMGSAAAELGFRTIADVSRERIRRVAAILTKHVLPVQADVGFRALKVDTTNRADILRTPDTLGQDTLDIYTDGVKPDRTGEDLLFQVLLDWGLELTTSIAVEQIDGREVIVVDDGVLIACFDDDLGRVLVRWMAGHEPLRAVFCDSSFASDADRINAEQVFAELSPSTDLRVI